MATLPPSDSDNEETIYLSKEESLSPLPPPVFSSEEERSPSPLSLPPVFSSEDDDNNSKLSSSSSLSPPSSLTSDKESLSSSSSRPSSSSSFIHTLTEEEKEANRVYRQRLKDSIREKRDDTHRRRIKDHRLYFSRSRYNSKDLDLSLSFSDNQQEKVQGPLPQEEFEQRIRDHLRKYQRDKAYRKRIEEEEHRQLYSPSSDDQYKDFKEIFTPEEFEQALAKGAQLARVYSIADILEYLSKENNLVRRSIMFLGIDIISTAYIFLDHFKIFYKDIMPTLIVEKSLWSKTTSHIANALNYMMSSKFIHRNPNSPSITLSVLRAFYPSYKLEVIQKMKAKCVARMIKRTNISPEEISILLDNRYTPKSQEDNHIQKIYSCLPDDSFTSPQSTLRRSKAFRKKKRAASVDTTLSSEEILTVKDQKQEETPSLAVKAPVDTTLSSAGALTAKKQTPAPSLKSLEKKKSNTSTSISKLLLLAIFLVLLIVIIIVAFLLLRRR